MLDVVRNMGTAFWILIIIFLAACQINTDDVAQEKKGKALAQKCITCHPKNSDFAQIRKFRSAEWIYAFVKNPSDFSTKNAEAKLLLDKWKPIVMTPFPNLSNKEIDLILNYYESN